MASDGVVVGSDGLMLTALGVPHDHERNVLNRGLSLENKLFISEKSVNQLPLAQ